ncbi:unnamed protein product [Alternaria sp. RS040]
MSVTLVIPTIQGSILALSNSLATKTLGHRSQHGHGDSRSLDGTYLERNPGFVFLLGSILEHVFTPLRGSAFLRDFTILYGYTFFNGFTLLSGLTTCRGFMYRGT